MSINLLVDQAYEVFNSICKQYDQLEKVMFLGHSLGGSICFKLANKLYEMKSSNFKKLISVIGIDSIEGTAKKM